MRHNARLRAPMTLDRMPDATPPACIGVFDSGVGGLSVLRAIARALPQARLHYIADSAFAPYGERRDAEILDRSRRIVARLIDRGARLIVVACNTATAVAIDQLRREHPHTVFVGVEPGVRPAMTLSGRKRIAVMATGATLRSERFRALVQREGAGGHVHAQACPGLAAAIERNSHAREDLRTLLERYAAEVRAAEVDVVALGCTHYPFVRQEIEAALGTGITVIDTTEAVAARVAQLWRPAAGTPSTAPCLLETTGDPIGVRDFVSRWLDIEVTVAPEALVL